jgi:ABC-type lipoprotein release transport system permease subunit
VVIPALKPVAVGIAAGLLLAGFGSPLVNQVLRADRLTRDPWDFATIAALAILTSIVAMAGPARRAMSSDPVEALREE